MDFRCPHRKFGEVLVPTREQGEIAVTCPSRWCGKRQGVTVLHVFSTRNGELLKTRQFRTPRGGGT